MAITIDGKTYRNIQEQVAKNAEDIAELKEEVAAIDISAVEGQIEELAESTRQLVDVCLGTGTLGQDANYVGTYNISFTYDGDDYELHFNGQLFNDGQCIALVNSMAGTSFTTLEEVETAWPTIAAGFVSQQSLFNLALTIAAAWITSPKTGRAYASLSVNGGGVSITSNSCTFNDSAVPSLGIGNYDAADELIGGAFVSSTFTYSAL